VFTNEAADRTDLGAIAETPPGVKQHYHTDAGLRQNHHGGESPPSNNYGTTPPRVDKNTPHGGNEQQRGERNNAYEGVQTIIKQGGVGRRLPDTICWDTHTPNIAMQEGAHPIKTGVRDNYTGLKSMQHTHIMGG